MKSKDRALEFINKDIHAWTVKEMAHTLGVSYSMARTVLKQLWSEGKIKRVQRDAVTPRGIRREWTYFRKGFNE